MTAPKDISPRSDTAATHAARLSVAPMMDWTDRHCRYFHRLISTRALLYTEMITAPALVRGRAHHLLDFNTAEHPVAVQLGGSDPAELAEAAAICADRGYDEINLNVGCPSDRVQSGCFGAVLMERPGLVADCVRAMIDAQPVEVTVKCRIGVDDQVPEDVLPDFLNQMQDAGITRVAIHARKAWLQGLSPKENRDIPPLNYPLVLAMKSQFPDLHMSLNGGLQTLETASKYLNEGLDGIMFGRSAYHSPWDVLADADRVVFGAPPLERDRFGIARAMMPYIAAHIADGGRAHQVTRHMLGLFAGQPGARGWRRCLSELATRPEAGAHIIEQALDQVEALAA